MKKQFSMFLIMILLITLTVTFAGAAVAEEDPAGLTVEEGHGAEQSDEKAPEDDQPAADQGNTAEDMEWLYALNRESISNMIIEDSPVYVIGHCSPDSDTVCSAVAYARLLTMLGYTAEAAVTAPVNKETAYILKTAGVECNTFALRKRHMHTGERGTEVRWP